MLETKFRKFDEKVLEKFYKKLNTSLLLVPDPYIVSQSFLTLGVL